MFKEHKHEVQEDKQFTTIFITMIQTRLILVSVHIYKQCVPKYVLDFSQEEAVLVQLL